MVRLRNQGGVNRQEVRLLQHLFEGHEPDIELLRPLFRHQRIEGIDLHAECLRALRHLGADLAQAENAEHFVIDLDALEALPVPAPLHEGLVGLREVPGQREQQGEGVLRRGEGVAVRRVHDDNPFPCCSLHIDVIDADSCPADELQLGGLVEESRRHLGLAPHEKPLIGS